MNNNTVVKTIGTDFVMKLLSQLSNKENSVISPYGIAAVLAMAAEGANEDSLNEILTCLGFASLDELRSAVLVVIKNPCEAFKSENALECNGVVLREPFKKKMMEKYKAEVREEKGTVAVQLSNLATFKAKWRIEMERNDVRPFYNADGSVSQPMYLKCSDDLRYYRDESFDPTVQAVALPYKKASYELVLVDSEKPLTQELLQEILSNMSTDTCQVMLPEFMIQSNHNLIPMLQSLGIAQIFDANRSPLEGIAVAPLYAVAFSQEAEIQVDENGTVATAFTAMTLCLKGGCGCERFCFNRPFAYFLRNTETGEILFAGKVNQLPVKCS